ncbi:MAG: DUF2851 family protein [Candidatus Thermochlorobacter sp.]
MAMQVPEKYVRHIWKNLYLQLDSLRLSDGRSLQILSTGKLNSNEGADFLDAKILIDGIEYTGAVEIHSRASDWLKHQHHLNARYDHVILHVVFEDDLHLPNAHPLLELRRFLNDAIHNVLAKCIQDESAFHRQHTIACFPTALEIDDSLKIEWLQTLSEQRFKKKVERFAQALTAHTLASYDELIYKGLMRALGYSENTTAFEALSRLVSFSELDYLKTLNFAERRRTLEAIYFSLSSLLPQQSDDAETVAYIQDLSQRFAATPFATRPPLDRLAWIFFRLRPQNFPTLRVAGLAEILSKNLEHGFLHQALQVLSSSVSTSRSIAQLEELFIADASDYWQHRYRFGARTLKPIKTLVGKTRATELVINTLLPVLALYAEHEGNLHLLSRVRSLYAEYPKALTSEVAKQTLQETLGEVYRIKSAAIEQGLLELKTAYCDALRCLDCRIGRAIFGT